MLVVEFLTNQHAPSRNKPFVVFQRGSLILYLSDRVGASGRESGVYDISTQQPTDFDVETRRIRSLVSLRSRLGSIIERTTAFDHRSISVRTVGIGRSEEHTSELQSLMRISYAVFCLQKKIYMYLIRHINITP